MNKIVLFGFLFLILTLPCSADSIKINSTNPIHFKHDFYDKNELTGLLSSEVELNKNQLFHALDYGEFKQMDRFAFNLSKNKSYRYIAIRVYNPLKFDSKLIWLVKNSAINRLVLYKRDSSGISQVVETGDHFKFNTRSIPFFLFAFPMELPSKKPVDFILLVDKRNENLFLPFKFYSEQDFDAYKNELNLIFGAISGAFIFMLLLNILLGITFRDRIHLIYFFYILGNLFVILSYEGLDFAYIYPEWPYLSDCSRYISTAMQLSFSLLLFRQYCGAKLLDSSSVFQKFGNLLLLLHIISIPTSFCVFIYPNFLSISHIIYLRIFSIANFMVMSFIIIDGIKRFNQGFKPAAFFIVAVSIMYIGGIEYSLNINGLIQQHLLFKSLIPNTITIGMIAELIVVTIGIVYLYNRLKNQRDRFEIIAMKTKDELLNASEVYRKQERNRIADDIHDGIASRIYGLRMFTDGILVNQNNKKLVADNLLKLRENLDEIGLHARAVIVDLHADGKVDVGTFSSELIRILEDFSKTTSIQIEITEVHFVENVILSKTQTDQLLKIVRETCNNINKHSQALFLRFNLHFSYGKFTIQFIEGPIQSNPLPFKQGRGLQSMISRSQNLGGEYNQFYHEKFIYTEIVIPINS